MRIIVVILFVIACSSASAQGRGIVIRTPAVNTQAIKDSIIKQVADSVSKLNAKISSLVDSLNKIKAVGYKEVDTTYIVGIDDNIINAVGGTFTIEMNILTRNRPITIVNTGSGVVTVISTVFVTPSFDGESSVIIYPGHGIELIRGSTGFITKSKF